MAGLHILTLTLQRLWGEVCLRKKSRAAGIRMLVSYACYLPTLMAMWIACTRIIDYWHHPSDCIAGSLLGFGCAKLAFAFFLPVAAQPNNGMSRTNEPSSLLLSSTTTASQDGTMPL